GMTPLASAASSVTAAATVPSSSSRRYACCTAWLTRNASAVVMPDRSGDSNRPPSPACSSAGDRSSAGGSISRVGIVSSTERGAASSSAPVSTASVAGSTSAGSVPAGGSSTSAWNASEYGSRTAAQPSCSAYAWCCVPCTIAVGAVPPG